MTISMDLFLALLAMDSYNRGYDPEVVLTGSSLGTASVGLPEDRSDWVGVGFYAISYTVGSGVEGIAPGTTVISYRGTDQNAPVVETRAA